MSYVSLYAAAGKEQRQEAQTRQQPQDRVRKQTSRDLKRSGKGGGWKLGIEAVRRVKDREEEEEDAHCGRKRRKRKTRGCGKLGFPRYTENYAA